MAIDLPPLDGIDNHNAAWQQRAASHQRLSIRTPSHQFQVFGTEQLLAPEAVESALADATDAASARRALLDAFAHAGYLNVLVAADAQAGQVRLWAMAIGFADIDGPERLKPYFDDFVGEQPVHYSDFAARQRLAQMHANRAGFEPFVLYEVVDEDRGRKQMKLRVGETRSPWDYAVFAGNTGNRYFGRWIGGGGVSWTHPSSWRLGGTYERAFPELGDDPSNADYNQVGLFGDRVRPWGVVRLDMQYADYDYQGQRGARLLPLAADAEQPQYEASNLQVKLSGEHFIYMSPHWQWSVSEALSYRRYRNEDVRTDQGRRDERYSQASGAVSGRWSNDDADSRPMLFLRAELRQSLDSEALGTDAQNRFTTLGAEVGAASNVLSLGRLVISAQAQHSDEPLPEAEEWVLGGMDRLNAWLPGVAVGDQGYYARAQYSTPTWTLSNWGLEFITAYEHGQTEFVRADGEGSFGRVRLADVAVGVNVLTESPWKLELRGARPVMDDGLNADYLRSQEVDFFLRVSRSWNPA